MSFPPRVADAERSVLVVDDDRDLLTQLASCLSAAGFCVAQASDGIDALSYLYATRPRAILVDLMMPRMDGLELIEQIRSDPNLDSMCVVAMSGMPNMLARAQKAGADEILCKPLEPVVLVRALSRPLRAGVPSSPGAPVSVAIADLSGPHEPARALRWRG